MAFCQKVRHEFVKRAKMPSGSLLKNLPGEDTGPATSLISREIV
jgi:hypothetical protein